MRDGQMTQMAEAGAFKKWTISRGSTGVFSGRRMSGNPIGDTMQDWSHLSSSMRYTKTGYGYRETGTSGGNVILWQIVYLVGNKVKKGTAQGKWVKNMPEERERRGSKNCGSAVSKLICLIETCPNHCTLSYYIIFQNIFFMCVWSHFSCVCVIKGLGVGSWRYRASSCVYV